MQIREGWLAQSVSALLLLAESYVDRSPEQLRTCLWPLCSVAPRQSGGRGEAVNTAPGGNLFLALSLEGGGCGSQGQASIAGADPG